MATVNETTTAGSARHGFNLSRCPMCGSEDATIRVNLHDTAEFVCSENECEFTADDVQEMIDQWSKVLAWAGSAPTLPE